MKRLLIPALLPLTMLLPACGGGGDDAGSTQAAVSSASVGPARYSQTALLTVNGSGLDASLNVSSAGCTGITRSTSDPTASGSNTAYYTCRVSAVGAQSFAIARSSGGAVLATAPFTVPQPQVTMVLNNAPATGVNGSMVLTLSPEKTPVTVDNFLAYVNAGFYDGTVFHRTVPGFVVQGGGFLPSGALKTPTLAPIALEVGKGLSNVQWSLAMARTDAANSATSQFYVNLVNNPALDPSSTSAGYAVFGSVTTNTALVDAVAAAPCGRGQPGSDCFPSPAVVITSARQTQ